MVTSEIPLGNLDLNQFEYPLPFACSQRFRLATAFRFIRVGTPLLGASPVLFSNTTPRAPDLPWAWTTSKAHAPSQLLSAASEKEDEGGEKGRESRPMTALDVPDATQGLETLAGDELRAGEPLIRTARTDRTRRRDGRNLGTEVCTIGSGID